MPRPWDPNRPFEPALPGRRSGSSRRSGSTRSPTGCCVPRSSWRARSWPRASPRTVSCGIATAYDPAQFSVDWAAPEERQFTVGFFGRGEPRKGLHLALRAWLDSGAAEGGRFVIAGGIEPAYEELLEPLLGHPSVQRLGHVADPAALMRACDVMVLPSFEEGSALVTYEGRACGCVLAISDRTGAPAENGVDALVHRRRGRRRPHRAPARAGGRSGAARSAFGRRASSARATSPGPTPGGRWRTPTASLSPAERPGAPASPRRPTRARAARRPGT